MEPMKVSRETYSWGASALLPFTNGKYTTGYRNYAGNA